MENEFIPYTEALALKELGFNEPCFGFYYLYKDENHQEGKFDYRGELNIEYSIYKENTYYILAPTYSQAFRWFRETYNLHGEPVSNSFNKWKYRITSLDESIILEHGCDQMYWIMGGFSNSYEEAELKCLKKLIQIIQTNS